MRCTVLHQGIPIGTADIPEKEGLVDAPFVSLPNYEAVRPLIDRVFAIRRGWNHMGSVNSWAETADELCEIFDALDIQDARGGRLATLYVAVAPDLDGRLWLQVEFGEDVSGVGARVPRIVRSDGEGQSM
jgi:hypothetical protein